MKRLIAWFVAFNLWVLKLTPAFISYRLATLAAWFATPFLMWHGRRAKPTRTSLRRNFKIAYGKDLSESEIRTLTYRVLKHMCWLVVDFARIPLFKDEALAIAASPETTKTLKDLVAEGKGLMGVGGHIGVFTLLGHIGGLMGLPLFTISTPRRNPHLQKVLHERQTGYGQKNIDKRGIARLLTGILKDKDMVGILVDEEAKYSEIFLPFMGTMATVNPLVARLHLLTGAPICVLNVHRRGAGRYELVISGVIKKEKGPRSERKQQQREIMEEINALLEADIRKNPTEWLWSSRRWRTRPPGEEPTEDGIPPRSLPPILPDFILKARAAKAGAASGPDESASHVANAEGGDTRIPS